MFINDATMCFEAAKANLKSEWPGDGECKHYMLTFLFTKKNSKRPDTKKWSGVKDTRAHMHSIMNTGKKITSKCTGHNLFMPRLPAWRQ